MTFVKLIYDYHNLRFLAEVMPLVLWRKNKNKKAPKSETRFGVYFLMENRLITNRNKVFVNRQQKVD